MLMQDRKKFLYGVIVEFRVCKGTSTAQDVKLLAHALAAEGFHPSPTKGGERRYITPNISALVDERYTEIDPNTPGHGGLCGSIDFPLLPDDFPPDISSFSFGWQAFKGKRVKVELYGGIWAYPEDRKALQEPLAENFLKLSLKLYPIAKPVLVCIREPDFDACYWKDSYILKRKIATLNWVNIFGPEYVVQYGRDILAGIPGYHMEDLSDGGLLYQSRSSIAIENKAAYKQWQRTATAYLASYNIHIRFDPSEG